MTFYKDTTLIIIKHLIENSKDELESIEFFISDIKKRIRLEQNVRSEISYQDIFSQIFNHLFDHHPELKLRASLLIENNTLDDDLQTQISLASWAERQYINPIPATVKRHVLFRHKIKDATWIETGTANGDTTLFLSQFAPLVYSIEPFEGFYLSSSVRLKQFKNIKLLNGTSEKVLPELIKTIKGDVCFFLDGHYSGDGTYLGEKECPLIDELYLIGKNLSNFNRVMIAIDDLHSNYEMPKDGYPSINFLISWAELNYLAWQIEHNMFIAMSKI